MFHKHNDSSTLVSWPSVKEDEGQMKSRRRRRRQRERTKSEDVRKGEWPEEQHALGRVGWASTLLTTGAVGYGAPRVRAT